MSRVAAFALAVLLLTTVHHVYGAYVYRTPWRLHAAIVSAFAAAVILGSLLVAQRDADDANGRLAFWVFATVTLVVPILLIGLFEGAYNHVLKNALYFGGAPSPVLDRLFPRPTYEMPNDLFFEMTGIAQVIPASLAGLLLYRLVRRRASSHSHAKIAVGDRVARRLLTTVSAEPVSVPEEKRLVHLQFRRFAGCPVCSLHLRSFVRRHTEIEAAGIREVVLFHSSAADLQPYSSEMAFAVVADPDKQLYVEFGVESSPRALLDPRAWPSIAFGVIRSLFRVVWKGERAPTLKPHGGSFGLPADFLIAPDGRLLAAKYGRHADDQWSVDDLLSHVRSYAGDRPATEPAAIRAS